MGGGGGSSRVGDLNRLREKAKEAVKPAAEQTKRNVFISFAYEDITEVEIFRGQAKNENSELEFNDFSVREPFDSDKAEYLRRQIRERIRRSSVTIVFLSDDTSKSKWVDWEIRESHTLGNKIVAVYQGDNPPAKLPAALTELKVRPIPWNHAAIIKAVSED